MFVYPVPVTPRVALLRGNLGHGRPVRYFDDRSHDYLERLAAFRPESFAGSLEQLRRIGRDLKQDILRAFDIRAIVVFAPVGANALTQTERDELWGMFQAPAFEQRLGDDGELIAAECEAHEGLHITQSLNADAPAGAILDLTPCGCGQTSPRIRFGASSTPDAAAA
jgi:hypothetical protein